MKNSIGHILKQWRKQKRYSQLQLSLELDISSKHICFIETGRSSPSREMILKIGLFLLVPKQEINRGLCAAGYAPFYTQRPAEHNDLKPVFSAIDHMIENHMPYPALVLNAFWEVIKLNQSAQNIFVALGYSNHNNLIEALIQDTPNTSNIINWHETVLSVLERLRQEISLMGGSKRLEALEDALSARLRIFFDDNKDKINMDEKQVVLPTKLSVFDKKLSFFSIISQLSTIQDVTVSEFKVELMFPSDEETKAFYKRGSN